MKVACPACRVRTSCASSAPSPCSEIRARIWVTISAGAALSRRPLTESRTMVQPDHRILRATRPAMSGSRIRVPVRATRATPTRTPPDVKTSAITWRGIGHQGGRAPDLAATQERHGPGGIDRRPHRADGKAQHRRIEGFRVEEAVIGFTQDEDGGHDDEGPLDHRREILGLVVPELMVLVGGRGGHAQGDEGEGRRRHVDDALQRVRIERETAR